MIEHLHSPSRIRRASPGAKARDQVSCGTTEVVPFQNVNSLTVLFGEAMHVLGLVFNAFGNYSQTYAPRGA
jgi:hypothetical protein